MNKDNLFWGVVFLMAAIYILMRSVGMAPDVSIVRIIIKYARGTYCAEWIV